MDITVDTYEEYFGLLNYVDQPNGVSHMMEGRDDNSVGIPDLPGTKGRRVFKKAMKRDVRMKLAIYDAELKGISGLFYSTGRAYTAKSKVWTPGKDAESWGMRIKGSHIINVKKVVTKADLQKLFPNLNYSLGGTMQSLPEEIIVYLEKHFLSK